MTASTPIAPLVPSLRYHDAPKAIDWLCDAFGFERHLVVPGENDTIAHAQLRFGNGLLMLGSGSGAGGRSERSYDRMVQPAEEREAVRPGSLYLVVADVDAHCARARAAGAEITEEPEEQAHGGRAYACRDLEGNVWTIGSYDPLAEG